jgi:hypothetical protein
LKSQDTPQIPKSDEIEKDVLGYMLIVAAPSVDGLVEADFLVPSHRFIFRQMREVLDERGQIDINLTEEKIKLRGRGDLISQFHALTTGVARVAHTFPLNVDRLKELSTQRKIQSEMNDLVDRSSSMTAAQMETAVDRIAIPLKKLRERKEPEPEPLIRVQKISDVEIKPIDWIWAGRIPRGALTIIEGAEGEGKSTLITAITATITKGYALPGDQEREPGAVLWCSAEDDLSRVLKPRLVAAGADVSMVHAIADPFRLDDMHLIELRALIASINPVLVVMDPFFAYTIGDSNKGGDSRTTTNPLKLTAEQFQCSIALVRHIGKAKGLGDPRAAGLYSIEWRAAARSVLLVGSDPNDKSRRAITQNKSNYGPISTSIGYAIDPDDSSPSGARFYWTGESSLTSAAILASIESEESRSSRRIAEEFLSERLEAGPVPEKDIAKDARTAGISAATLRRAKAALGVKSNKRGGHFGGQQEWDWTLPGAEDAQPEDENTEDAHIHLDERLQ